MSLDLHTEVVGPLLYATLRGTFGVHAAKLAYRGALERCIASGLSMMLLDCRRVEGEPTMMERFDFAEFTALENLAAVDSGRTAPVQLALVGEIPLIDPFRFGETVARNRGAWVKVTTERDEAIRWLGMEAYTLPDPDPEG